jgi:hypothetical protein
MDALGECIPWRHICRQDPLVYPTGNGYKQFVPGSPISSGGRMSKRKKTDIVNLKLRIREVLRKRLETAAKAQERSLNSEMSARLANSFDRARDSDLLEVLLAPGDGLELLRAIATVLQLAGADWGDPPKNVVVGDAINKVVAVFMGELPAVAASFPDADNKGTGDHFAWLAVLVMRVRLSARRQLTEGEKS